MMPTHSVHMQPMQARQNDDTQEQTMHPNQNRQLGALIEQVDMLNVADCTHSNWHAQRIAHLAQPTS